MCCICRQSNGPAVCKSILATGSSSPTEHCLDSSPKGAKAQTPSQILLSKLKALAANIQRKLKKNRDNMNQYQSDNAETLPDLLAVGKQLLQDTYDAIIMWMDPEEVTAQMGPGMSGRATVWRQSRTSRLSTYLQRERAACNNCDDLWQSRQKAIIKSLLADIVSALDYMATAALQLSPEYCYASKAARKSAMKTAYFPFEELAAAEIDFVQTLHQQGIKACRDEVAHQHAAELAFPDGKVYRFDLMALKGLHTNVGAQVRAFDVPGMHWLECILKARRRIKMAFQHPELLKHLRRVSAHPSMLISCQTLKLSARHCTPPSSQDLSQSLTSWLLAQMLSLRTATQTQEQLGTPSTGMAEPFCALRRSTPCAKSAR